MKTLLSSLFLLIFLGVAASDPKGSQPALDKTVPTYNPLPASGENDDTGISRVALSVNPLGFVQFGPMVNLEFGLTENVILNTHVRFLSLGLLTYAIYYHDDGLDELSGIAFGGGPVVFLGEKQHKPYAGMLFEYDKTNMLFAKDESWEWEKTTNTFVFVCNGGYRFRFNGGFYINTGVYLGAAFTRYAWEYTDITYGESDDTSRDGTDITPFGMLEVSLGIEF